jgi:hypothetical protein
MIPEFENPPMSCEKLCRTKFELFEEKAKNYQLMKDVEKYKQDTASLFRQLSLVFALNLYIDRMKDIPLVEAIFLVKRESLSDIWTIIRESNLEQEEKIADAQCELMRIHQELDFDFMVIPKNGKKMDDLLPDDRVQIYPTNEFW